MIMKIKQIIQEEINEYLDNQFTAPLNNYLKNWNEDQIVQYYWKLIPKFLAKEKYISSKECDILLMKGQDYVIEELEKYPPIVKERFINRILYISQRSNIKTLADFFDSENFTKNANTGLTLKNKGVFKTNWLIHFTPLFNTSWMICRQGFKKAIPQHGMTNYLSFSKTLPSNERVDDGYSYGYDTNDSMNLEIAKYSNGAVLFVAPGLKIYHRWDDEMQVVFRSTQAKNFILLAKGEGDKWCVCTKNGKYIIENKPLTYIIEWVKTNYRQYAKILTWDN